MDYRLVDILDLPTLQHMFSTLWDAHGIPAGLIDAAGNVQVAVGWQKVCTEYHSRHPDLEERCLLNHLEHWPDRAAVKGSRRPLEFSCQSGLVDLALPLYLDQRYLGLLFVGQIFLEQPDPAFFSQQAQGMGYDPDAYLAMIDEVPVIPRKQLENHLDFLSSLVTQLCEAGKSKLQAEQSRRELMETEQGFYSLFSNSNDGIGISNLDGRLIECNKAFCDLLGYTRDELLALNIWQITEEGVHEKIVPRIKEVIDKGSVTFETLLKDRSGASVPADLSTRHIRFRGQDVLLANIHDLRRRKAAERAIYETESRFRLIFEEAAVGIVTIDCEGRLVQANPYFCELLGYSAKELVGRKVSDITAPEDRGASSELIRLASPNDVQVIDLEKRYLRKDGTTVWGRVVANYFEPETDSGISSVAMIQNISRRKEMEAALRESEQSYSNLIEASPMGIHQYVLEGEDRLIFSGYNRAADQILGVDSSQYLGKELLEAFPDLEGTEVPVRYLEVSRTGRPWQTRQFTYGAGDSMKAFDVYAFQPSPGRVACMFSDMTERMWAEQELLNALKKAQQARAQVDSILRSTADGIIVVNPLKRILLVNEAAESLLSRTHSELHGVPIERVIPDDSLLEKVNLTLSGDEQSNPVDLRPRTKADATEEVLEARVTTMSAEEDQVNGAIITLRDVTRERALDSLKDEFISTAAHELRTPMTSILGYTELMLEQLSTLDEESLREFLSIVYERSNTLATIIGDMLDLSRVQSGRLITLDMTIGDLNPTLQHSVAPYRIANARHTFSVQTTEGAPQVVYDTTKIAQVLDNLISNAVKFSPKGGMVRLAAVYGEDEVLITVSDEGIGMTPDQMERVFDKFFRADSSNTAVSGLGLGMSLVKGIVEAHGGRIWVESEPGAGTQVFFTLPYKPAIKDAVGR